MKRPSLKVLGEIYSFEWLDEGITARIDRLHEDSKGIVTGEITVKSTKDGNSTHLHQTRMSLTSTTSRNTVAKQLDGRKKDLDWGAMLEQACVITLEKYREGEPVEKLWPQEEIKPLEFLLHPVLPLNQPTVIFGDGSAGKSYLTLLFAVILNMAWVENPLGLRPLDRPVNTVILDWESDKGTYERRLALLQKGLSLPRLPLLYRRCWRSFSEDIYEIQKYLLETNAECVIIDSIVAACGDDPKASQVATKLINHDLRQLGNVTGICVGHVTKEKIGEKTPFGSAFWWNSSRSVWEVQKHQEVGEDRTQMGMFHRKANDSKLFPPLGFLFSFFEDGIIVEAQDVKKVPGLSKGARRWERILALLNESGLMSVKDIAEALRDDQESIRTTLYQYNKLFVKRGKEWGLLETRYNDP